MEPPAGQRPVAETEQAEVVIAEVVMVGSGMAEAVMVEFAPAERPANPASAQSGLACTGWKEEPPFDRRRVCLKPSSSCVPGVLD